MAALTLLSKPTPTTIDDLPLDATISVSFAGDVDATEHPVEEGAAIIDHARPKAETVTIEGVISNTPISSDQQTRRIESQGFLFEAASGDEAPRGQPGYAEDAFVRLRALKDAGRLVSIVTQTATYENMLLTSLRETKNAQSGDAFRFSATFKRVRLVRNQTRTVTIPSARGKKNLGKQNLTTTDTATAAKAVEPVKNQSLAFGIGKFAAPKFFTK
jgi:hypothetical protein